MRCGSSSRTITAILAIAACLAATRACSKEKDGNIVIQTEDTALSPGWRFSDEIGGYTGDGYITWVGENQYRFDGEGKLKYRICATGGTYLVKIWSMRLRKPGLREDEGNDVWIFDGNTPTKLFTYFGHKMDEWKLSLFFDINHEKREPFISLKPGCQSFEIAARSERYSLDRIILAKQGSKLDLQAPSTVCNSDNGRNPASSPTDCSLPAKIPSVNRSKIVQMRFKNRRDFTVKLYKNDPASRRLTLVDEIEAGEDFGIDAFEGDFFAVSKLDGSCLRQSVIVGQGAANKGIKKTILQFQPPPDAEDHFLVGEDRDGSQFDDEEL